MSVEGLNSFFQRTLIAIFFVLIITPGLKMALGDKAVFSYAEKRPLAASPQIPENVTQVQNFFQDLDSYLNDHFGYREWMIYRYQRELRKRFPDSQDSVKVLKGADNWYFNTDNRLLEDFTGRNLLSDNNLNKWILSYNNKQKWLAQRGVHYLLIVPPNKQTIFSEFIGEALRSHKGTSRFTQIKNKLSAKEKSTLVDLTPILLKHKDAEALFFKSDTHWTPYGAYLGYTVIAEKIEALFPDLQFKKDFTFTKTITRRCDSSTKNCGDLTNMLLDYEVFAESYRNVNLSHSCAVKKPLDFQPQNTYSGRTDRNYRTSCPQGKLKAVVFFDSFFVAVEPYLSESFKEVVYLFKAYDQNDVELLLETFKPDIIIEERVERFIGY
jgi:hypothetical protein